MTGSQAGPESGPASGPESGPASGPESGPANGRFAGHDPQAGADTAGTEWAGRLLAPSPFAGDDGAPDAAVRAALHALSSGTSSDHMSGGTGASPASGSAERALLEALASARLFAAIEAVPAEVDDSGPLAREVESDMASPVLTAPDGRRAMLLYTGLDTLAAWQGDARPVPVTGPDAAVAALDVQRRAQVTGLEVSSSGQVQMSLGEVEVKWGGADDAALKAAVVAALVDRAGIRTLDVRAPQRPVTTG